MAPLNTGFWVGGKRGVLLLCVQVSESRRTTEREIQASEQNHSGWETGEQAKSFSLSESQRTTERERQASKQYHLCWETGERTKSFGLKDRQANKIIRVERQASEQNHLGWETGKRSLVASDYHLTETLRLIFSSTIELVEIGNLITDKFWSEPQLQRSHQEDHFSLLKFSCIRLSLDRNF